MKNIKGIATNAVEFLTLVSAFAVIIAVGAML